MDRYIGDWIRDPKVLQETSYEDALEDLRIIKYSGSPDLADEDFIYACYVAEKYFKVSDIVTAVLIAQAYIETLDW